MPIAKTNLAQAMFFVECTNPVWGRTLNPYSRAHSSGGSSGGEGALLAMDGAALGWGSDVGGSLRFVTSPPVIGDALAHAVAPLLPPVVRPYAHARARIPAAACGIYSLKPGVGRIGVAGMQGTHSARSFPTLRNPAW